MESHASRKSCPDTKQTLKLSWVMHRTTLCCAYCRPHQALTFVWEFAKLSYLPHAHIGVADNGLQSLLTLRRSRDAARWDSEAFCLYVTRGLHACADRFT
jgi:hypothetical protein